MYDIYINKKQNKYNTNKFYIQKKWYQEFFGLVIVPPPTFPLLLTLFEELRFLLALGNVLVEEEAEVINT